MILHAIPGIINEYEYGAGNWKGLEANRLGLREAGMLSTEAAFDWKAPQTLLPHVTPDTTHLLMEYSWWPEILTQIRKKQRKIKICVRTHNAEAYQHIHRTRTCLRDNANFEMWKKFLHLVRRDMRCKQAADTLLGISEWDDAHYWKWLPGKAVVRYLPYFSPWPYLRKGVEPQPWHNREAAVVSMGGNFDPSGMANVHNFDLLAMNLARTQDKKWSFLLTWWSRWNKNVPKVSSNVSILRECQEPWDLLCRVRALAVLTPLGFGFKTTVVDGLAAGCHVIIHPKLATRLPAQVRQLCLICDPSRDEDIARIEASLSRPADEHNLNNQLREAAIHVLRSTFRQGD